MKLRYGWGAAVLIAVVVVGCTKAPRGGPREKTHEVTGVVLVDDAPVEGIMVTATPEQGTSKVPYPISALSDKQGKFIMNTYEGNDGLPEGTFRLTFAWYPVGIIGAPDQMHPAYKDVAKSAFVVKITPDKEKYDLGTLKLFKDGPPEAAAPAQ